MAERGVFPNQTAGTSSRRGKNFVGDQPDLVTSYSYDAKNRKTFETVSGGGLSLTAMWQYNPAGQLIQATDATRTVTSYSYANGVNSGGDLHGGRTVVTLPGNYEVTAAGSGKNGQDRTFWLQRRGGHR